MVCLCPYDWNIFLKTVKANSYAVCLLLLCLKIFFYEEFIFTFEKIPVSCLLQLLKSFNLITLFWRDLFNWEGTERTGLFHERSWRQDCPQHRQEQILQQLYLLGPLAKGIFRWDKYGQLRLMGGVRTWNSLTATMNK